MNLRTQGFPALPVPTPFEVAGTGGYNLRDLRISLCPLKLLPPCCLRDWPIFQSLPYGKRCTGVNCGAKLPGAPSHRLWDFLTWRDLVSLCRTTLRQCLLTCSLNGAKRQLSLMTPRPTPAPRTSVRTGQTSGDGREPLPEPGNAPTVHAPVNSEVVEGRLPQALPAPRRYLRLTPLYKADQVPKENRVPPPGTSPDKLAETCDGEELDPRVVRTGS